MKLKSLFYQCLYLAVLLFLACDDKQSSVLDPHDLWEQVGILDSVNVYEFVIDPEDNLYIGSSFGIFKSTNSGETWLRLNVTSPDSDQGYLSLAVDKSGNLLAGDLFYLRRSTDQGVSWSILYSNDKANSYISTIAVFGDTVFVAQNRGFWVRSLDNGMSWTLLSQGSDGMEALVRIQGVLIGGSRFGGLSRSHNNGDTWEGVGACPTWSIAKTISGYIYAATEQCGVLRSTDFGDTWQSTTSDTSLFYRVFAINDTSLITAGVSGQIYVSTNQGSSWIDKTNNFAATSIWGIATDSQGYVYITARSSDSPANRDPTYIYRAKIEDILSQ